MGGFNVDIKTYIVGVLKLDDRWCDLLSLTIFKIFDIFLFNIIGSP